VFVVGLTVFALASLLVGLAPTPHPRRCASSRRPPP